MRVLEWLVAIFGETIDRTQAGSVDSLKFEGASLIETAFYKGSSLLPRRIRKRIRRAYELGLDLY